MKKLIICAIMLAAGVSSYAQQALFGGANAKSPEINADKTVTFRFVAPKAISVKVTGDFLPTRKVEVPNFGSMEMPGQADLVEKDGVWEYTTPTPVAPEMYTYSFIVDGQTMVDPNNVYMK